MTKTTSAKRVIGKQLLMLPVAAIAILMFSQKVQAKVLTKAGSATLVTSKKDTVMPNKVRIPIPEVMRTTHAASDAPEKVLSEYAAILKKYDIPNGKGKSTEVSAADKAQLHTLFTKMSLGQQELQLFRFTKASKPMPKSKINADQLGQWQQDAQKYGVWVDDKRIKNADLAKYNPEDFDHLYYSRLAKNAAKLDGFHFQVDLMTKANYAKYYKETIANQEDRVDYLHILIANKSKVAVTRW